MSRTLDEPTFAGPARLRDVAERAGVSIALVSSYINNPQQVGGKSAVKIEEAIAFLGFIPNDAARQLRRGISRMIAFVAFDVGDAFFASVSRGAQRRAAEEGLSLVLADSNGKRSTEREYLTLFGEQRVRGLLLAPVAEPSSYLDEVGLRQTRVVFIDQPAPSHRYGSVSINDVLGGRLAAAHLLQLGRRRIAYVGGPGSIRQVADRLRGAREAVREVPGSHLEVFDTENRDAHAGRDVAEALMRRAPADRPNGIFCVNDNIAAGLLQVFLRHPDIRVPRDVAVVGYNDVAADAASVIPLTSIKQPHEAFGQTAVDLLLEEFVASKQASRRQVVFDPELVIRESTAG